MSLVALNLVDLSGGYHTYIYIYIGYVQGFQTRVPYCKVSRAAFPAQIQTALSQDSMHAGTLRFTLHRSGCI